MDLAVKKVEEGDTFVYVLDNIDWMEKVHDMKPDAQNKSVHAVATCLVFDRITSKDLPDDGPKKNLKDCDMIELGNLTDEETNIILQRNDISSLLQRSCTSTFLYLNFYRI